MFCTLLMQFMMFRRVCALYHLLDEENMDWLPQTNNQAYKNWKLTETLAGKWILISGYSARATQWIPTWKGLYVFQKSLHPCVFDKLVASSFERLISSRPLLTVDLDLPSANTLFKSSHNSWYNWTWKTLGIGTMPSTRASYIVCFKQWNSSFCHCRVNTHLYLEMKYKVKRAPPFINPFMLKVS